MQNYKNLKVWLKAHELTLKIYIITRKFPQVEMYALSDQMRRSSCSIAANLAEGCGKNTNPDLAKYLNIALGSANETEYFLLLSKDLGYLKIEEYNSIDFLVNEVKAMLISLIQKVRISEKVIRGKG